MSTSFQGLESLQFDLLIVHYKLGVVIDYQSIDYDHSNNMYRHTLLNDTEPLSSLVMEAQDIYSFRTSC